MVNFPQALSNIRETITSKIGEITGKNKEVSESGKKGSVTLADGTCRQATIDEKSLKHLSNPKVVNKWNNLAREFKKIDSTIRSGQDFTHIQSGKYEKKLKQITNSLSKIVNNKNMNENDRKLGLDAMDKLAKSSQFLREGKVQQGSETRPASTPHLSAETEKTKWANATARPSSPAPTMSNIINEISKRELTSSEKELFVDQITNAMAEKLKQVTPEELQISPDNAKYLSDLKEGKESRPNLRALHNMSTGMTNHIVNELLKNDSPDARGLIITNFTKMASISLENGNMLLATSITQGLFHSAVQGMKDAKVPLFILNAMKHLDSVTSDFMQYNQNIQYIERRNLSQNAIPNIQSFTSRFVSLYESDKKTQSELKELNDSPPSELSSEAVEKRKENGAKILERNANSRNELKEKLNNIQKTLSRSNQEISPELDALFQKKDGEFEITESKLLRGVQLQEQEVAQVANLLNQASSYYLMRINPDELDVDAEKFPDRAATLTQMTNYINTVSSFTINTILSRNNLQERTNAFSNMVAIMDKAIKNGDLNTGLSIYSALNGAAISRLKKTQEGLPSQAQERMKQADTLFDPDRNQKNLKDFIQENNAKPDNDKTKLSLSPVFTMISKDFAFGIEGNLLKDENGLKQRGEDGKLQLTEAGNDQISKFKSDFQLQQDAIKQKTGALELPKTGPFSQIVQASVAAKGDKEAYDISLQLEPRGA